MGRFVKNTGGGAAFGCWEPIRLLVAGSLYGLSWFQFVFLHVRVVFCISISDGIATARTQCNVCFFGFVERFYRYCAQGTGICITDTADKVGSRSFDPSGILILWRTRTTRANQRLKALFDGVLRWR